MEKRIWSKPEVNLIQFEANEFVTACSNSFTARLLCVLPNDPTKVDGYDSIHKIDAYGGWHGSCGSEDLTKTPYQDFVNGAWVGNVPDSYEGTDTWDVQFGSYLGTTLSDNLQINSPEGIGDLISDFISTGYYLASWIVGHLNTNGQHAEVLHYGVAHVTSYSGDANRS